MSLYTSLSIISRLNKSPKSFKELFNIPVHNKTEGGKRTKRKDKTSAFFRYHELQGENYFFHGETQG